MDLNFLTSQHACQYQKEKFLLYLLPAEGSTAWLYLYCQDYIKFTCKMKNPNETTNSKLKQVAQKIATLQQLQEGNMLRKLLPDHKQ